MSTNLFSLSDKACFFGNSRPEIISLHLYPFFYFSIKWLFHTYLGFHLFFRDLIIALVCVVIVVLVRRLFVFGRLRRVKYIKLVTINKSMIVNMQQNWSHGYYSHNSNIKYIDITIKYVGFKRIHYAINLDVISFFMIFSDFGYIFMSMYFESIK